MKIIIYDHIYINMSIFNGEMIEIFKIDKFVNILPIGFNVFIFEDINEKFTKFKIYIAREEQDLTKEYIDTSKIAGYISCVGSLTNEVDFDDLEIELQTIHDDLVTFDFDIDLILDYIRGESVHLGRNEKKILSTFQLRLIQKDLNIKFVGVEDEFTGNGIGKYLLILASTYAYRKYKILKITLDDDSDNSWKKK